MGGVGGVCVSFVGVFVFLFVYCCWFFFNIYCKIESLNLYLAVNQKPQN